ncbi:hypothetical protein SEUCBS140593_002699 [Sporothrix eucalyptigena]|uniref:Uncharacterized protein n=1 Tax=Sporothrix eucalyptigena TaxID=1812306 RepID=A0ABP0B8U7_9PEZI
MIAGHITNSQVESAATGLADLIRHLVKNANRMGLLSQSVYRTSSSSQAIAPIALHYKQVFWAKFVALAFAVFSEHALRMDLAIGGSEWARQVPEPTAAEALMIPDRSQTPTPTPLTGRVYRLDGFLSLDNMVPEYWWRYGRNVDTAWDNFLNKYYEIRSKPPIYHKDEVENPHNPIPDDARLPDDSDESGYADYSAYKDYGILDDMLQLYEMLEEGSKSSGNDIFMTDCEEEEDSEGVGERKDNRKHGALRGITKAQLLANPRSLNLIAQFTTVRIRGGLQALSSIIYGDGNRRPDAETVLARNQFDMIQAMANDSFHSYKGLLYWGPLEGPLSHTGIRATRQKLANTYRHPLELYSAVV